MYTADVILATGLTDVTDCVTECQVSSGLNGKARHMLFLDLCVRLCDVLSLLPGENMIQGEVIELFKVIIAGKRSHFLC